MPDKYDIFRDVRHLLGEDSAQELIEQAHRDADRLRESAKCSICNTFYIPNPELEESRVCGLCKARTSLNEILAYQ